jgi:hypothetical protein
MMSSMTDQTLRLTSEDSRHIYSADAEGAMHHLEWDAHQDLHHQVEEKMNPSAKNSKQSFNLLPWLNIAVPVYKEVEKA